MLHKWCDFNVYHFCGGFPKTKWGKMDIGDETWYFWRAFFIDKQLLAVRSSLHTPILLLVEFVSANIYGLAMMSAQGEISIPFTSLHNLVPVLLFRCSGLQLEDSNHPQVLSFWRTRCQRCGVGSLPPGWERYHTTGRWIHWLKLTPWSPWPLLILASTRSASSALHWGWENPLGAVEAPGPTSRSPGSSDLCSHIQKGSGWCWYINANHGLGYIDGIHGTPFF